MGDLVLPRLGDREWSRALPWCLAHSLLIPGLQSGVAQRVELLLLVPCLLGGWLHQSVNSKSLADTIDGYTQQYTVGILLSEEPGAVEIIMIIILVT